MTDLERPHFDKQTYHSMITRKIFCARNMDLLLTRVFSSPLAYLYFVIDGVTESPRLVLIRKVQCSRAVLQM